MQPFGRNRYGLKIGELSPFGEGDLGGHLTKCGQGAEAYLRAKFHLDPCNRLATVHERYKQPGLQQSQIYVRPKANTADLICRTEPNKKIGLTKKLKITRTHQEMR